MLSALREREFLRVTELGEMFGISVRERVVHIAGMLGLEELLDRKPANLSGGSGSASRWGARSRGSHSSS